MILGELGWVFVHGMLDQQYIQPIECAHLQLHQSAQARRVLLIICGAGMGKQVTYGRWQYFSCMLLYLSGYSIFRRLNSSSMVSKGLSLMSSMFSHPITYSGTFLTSAMTTLQGAQETITTGCSSFSSGALQHYAEEARC